MNKLTVSPDFDAIGSALDEMKRLREIRKELIQAMMSDSKGELVRMAERILWMRSAQDIAEFILEDYTPQQILSLAHSYGLNDKESEEG